MRRFTPKSITNLELNALIMHLRIYLFIHAVWMSIKCLAYQQYRKRTWLMPTVIRPNLKQEKFKDSESSC